LANDLPQDLQKAALCADMVIADMACASQPRKASLWAIRGGPLSGFKTRGAVPEVLVSTYYYAILRPWMTSQPIFITY
jgi:hypothetical protein